MQNAEFKRFNKCKIQHVYKYYIKLLYFFEIMCYNNVMCNIFVFIAVRR